MFRRFGAYAAVAAILGLISVAVVPVIYVIGMISVIGIPVAMAALVFPTLCLAVVIAYAIWRLFLYRFPLGVPLSFIGAFAVMIAVPLVHNVLVTWDVRSLRAGDVAGQVARLTGDETLVVFTPRHRTNYCDEICVELLTTRQVAAYAAVKMPGGDADPAPDAQALVHQLVRAPSCGERLVSLRNQNWKKNQPRTAANALAQAEAKGMCLRSVEMKLDQLDAPRFIAFFDKNNLDYSESVLFIDTEIRPSRTAVYERTPAGALSPVFQDTRVSYSPLQPLLAYGVSSLGDLSSVKSQWWRKRILVDRPEVRDYLYSVFDVRFSYQ